MTNYNMVDILVAEDKSVQIFVHHLSLAIAFLEATPFPPKEIKATIAKMKENSDPMIEFCSSVVDLACEKFEYFVDEIGEESNNQ